MFLIGKVTKCELNRTLWLEIVQIRVDTRGAQNTMFRTRPSVHDPELVPREYDLVLRFSSDLYPKRDPTLPGHDRTDSSRVWHSIEILPGPIPETGPYPTLPGHARTGSTFTRSKPSPIPKKSRKPRSNTQNRFLPYPILTVIDHTRKWFLSDSGS